MNSLTMFNREWAQLLQLSLLALLSKKDLTKVRKFINENIENYKRVFDENFGQWSCFSTGVCYLNMLQNIDISNERLATERSSTHVEFVSMFYQIDDQNEFSVVITDSDNYEIGSWTISIDETGEAKLSCEHDL